MLDVVQCLRGHVSDFLPPIHNYLAGKRVPSVGCAQNGAAAGENPAHLRPAEHAHALWFHQTIKAVSQPEHLQIEFVLRCVHYRADDRVQAGRVAATGEDAYAAHCFRCPPCVFVLCVMRNMFVLYPSNGWSKKQFSLKLSCIKTGLRVAVELTGCPGAIDFSPSATDNYVSNPICGGVDIAMKVPVVRNVA